MNAKELTVVLRPVFENYLKSMSCSRLSIDNGSFVKPLTIFLDPIKIVTNYDATSEMTRANTWIFFCGIKN